MISAANRNRCADRGMLNPENADHFIFKMDARRRVGLVGRKVVERALKKPKQFRVVVLRFRDQLEQLDKVRGERDGVVSVPNRFMCGVQCDFAQNVKITFPAADILNLAFKKEIEPASKTALGLQR